MVSDENKHVTELRSMIRALWATDTPDDARSMMLGHFEHIATQLAEAESNYKRIRGELVAVLPNLPPYIRRAVKANLHPGDLPDDTP